MKPSWYQAVGGSALHPTLRDPDGGASIVDDDRHYLAGVKGPHHAMTRAERIGAGCGTEQDLREHEAERQHELIRRRKLPVTHYLHLP